MPKVSQNMGHDHCGKGVEEGRQNIWGVPQTAVGRMGCGSVVMCVRSVLLA